MSEAVELLQHVHQSSVSSLQREVKSHTHTHTHTHTHSLSLSLSLSLTHTHIYIYITDRLQVLPSSENAHNCVITFYLSNLCIHIYCYLLSFRWLEYRTKAEIFYGLPVQREVCSKDEIYSRMDLSRAIVPPQFFMHPVYPDDSPDELLPIGYNGYAGTDYL